MTSLGLYVPGRTPLHRAPAGVKLALLLAVVTVVVLLPPVGAAVAALVAAALYPLCGLPSHHLWGVLRPLLPFLALIALFQAVTAGPQVALGVCARLAAAVLAASLVTLTTRVAEMLALFERLARPLRLVGVRPDRAALVLALTVRCVPMVAAAWRGAREACLARGIRPRPHRLVVPVVVGMVRSAEALGEAMSARGLD
ncbi:CbiQ family ECF transporter T component [Marinactinospora thermotolerans]|uniref:CbiQ family ECF transporter T component n=1 Tax=Marinactinospora thermotolerans TaxID=531310 RepID=UPI003D8EA701